MALKVGTFDSMNEFEASLKGNAGFIRFIGDEPMVVRFLTEPDEWVKYTSHFDQDNKMAFPCDDSSCAGCMEGMNTSTRYLTNALVTEEQRVVPLQIPITLATILTRRYKKFNTLLDRDYELSKDGEGFKTKYDATPEAPTTLRMSRYEKLDLLEILQDAMDEYDTIAAIAGGTAVSSNGRGKVKSGRSKPETLDDDEDDEDERPARRGGAVARKRVAGGPGKKRPGVKRASKPVDDDEDEEVETPARKARVAGRAKAVAATRGRVKPKPEPEPEPEDDDEDDVATDGESVDDLMKLGLRALRNILKAEFGWTPADYKGLDVDELAKAIVEARTEAGDDDVEVDDETGADEDEDIEEDDSDDEDGEDAEDDSDDDYYSEEDLKAMSLAELKALAKESGITVKRSMGQADIIAALLDEEEENEDKPPF